MAKPDPPAPRPVPAAIEKVLKQALKQKQHVCVATRGGMFFYGVPIGDWDDECVSIDGVRCDWAIALDEVCAVSASERGPRRAPYDR